MTGMFMLSAFVVFGIVSAAAVAFLVAIAVIAWRWMESQGWTGRDPEPWE